MTRLHSIAVIASRTLFLLALIVALSLFSPAYVALADVTINVSTFSDVISNDGFCSLREAITAANTNTASGAAAGECPAGTTGTDTILLPAGTYALGLAGAGENANATGDLDITNRTVIRGLGGADGTIIDGASLDRVFHVQTSNAVVHLQNLSITHGRSPDGVNATASANPAPGQNGGAMLLDVLAHLAIASVRVTDSRAGDGGDGFPDTTHNWGHNGGYGGGVFVSSSSYFTMTDSAVRGNGAGDAGIGVGTSGTCSGGNGGRGGGLYVDLTGRATVNGSTIAGNRGGNGGARGAPACGPDGYGGSGGGAFSIGFLTLNNSTVSTNRTGNGGGTTANPGLGGGVAQTTNGALTLNGATVSGNSTSNIPFAASGGGIYFSPSATATVKNSVIAGNTNPGGSTPDCFTSLPINSQDYNLLGVFNSNCQMTGVRTHVISNTNALLLSLAYAGGPGLTHALHPSSPAKDWIPNGTNGCGAAPLNLDQRGQPRPVNASCDMGAFELQASETITQRTGLATGVSTTFTGTDVAVVNTAASTYTGTVTVDKHEATPPNANLFNLTPLPVYWNVGAVPWAYDLSVSFGYTPAQLGEIAEAELHAYRWDTVQRAWVSMGGTVDAAQNLVTVTGINTAGDWMLAARTCFVRLNDSPTEYDSIQAAVDASSSGTDVVKVAGSCGGVSARDGVTQTVYLAKSLTVRGGYSTANWTTPDPVANPTTVNAGGLGRVFYITGTVAPVIEGLRITGGDARGLRGASLDGEDVGGGIYLALATATITNNIIYENVADDGAGISLGASNSVIARNTLQSNVAGARIGGYGGGISVYGASPIIHSNIFASNTAIYSETNGRGGDGGGIQYFHSTPNFRDNTVHGNTAEWGAGLAVVECTGGNIESNLFLSNTAAWNAGGIGAYQFDDGAISGNEFIGNEADSDAGGLLIEDSAVTVAGNTIAGNQAVGGSAGGIRIDGSAGAVIADNEVMSNTANWAGAGIFIEGDPILTGNTIMYNQGNDGAGIHVAGGNPVLWSNTVSRNVANWQGGGIKIDSGSPVFSNTLITYNKAMWEGAGILVDGAAATFVNPVVIFNDLIDGNTGAGVWTTGGRLTLLHPTIVDNDMSGGASHGIYLKGSESVLTMTNGIVTSQLVGVYAESGSTATIDGILWHGNGDDTDGSGTIIITHDYTGDPAFAADEYHINAGSAAINKGVPAGVPADIDGEARPYGPAPDLGADEFLGYKLFIPVVLRG